MDVVGIMEPNNLGIIKIKDLSQGDQKVNILIKVVEKQMDRYVFSRKTRSQHRLAEFLVGDETGCILLSLWDDTIEKISLGKTYRITEGYVSEYNGTLRLNIGKGGRVEEAKINIEEVNLKNNLSEYKPSIDRTMKFLRARIKGERKPSRSRRRRK
ncbi:MAG: hypothetical protein J7L50_00390 [Candidatus Odinarchaeota archaeon]|nr:hypothetical protein [Candidatus Odinarchaeota archaeon]